MTQDGEKGKAEKRAKCAHALSTHSLVSSPLQRNFLSHAVTPAFLLTNIQQPHPVPLNTANQPILTTLTAGENHACL